jgi:hypothetical protein
MPYLKQGDRFEVCVWPDNVGELNYTITNATLNFLDKTEGRYADYNAAIGVLECAKLELYRRMVAPYEDHKCMVNGDVYP